MIAEQFSATTMATSSYTRNYSSGDKMQHPSIQLNSNLSTLMCSPKHSVNSIEFNNVLLKCVLTDGGRTHEWCTLYVV